MNPVQRPLSLLLLAGSLAAQSRISPIAYTQVEGNASSSIPWMHAAARAQQADGEMLGNPLVITRLTFRRDGVSSSTTAVARTLDATLLLGPTSIATFGTSFAGNFTATPTVVFARRSVNFPDWTPPPTSRPMPFSLAFTLDAPFPHSGSDALLLELRGENSSSTGTYAMDWASAASPAYGATPTVLGAGCTTPTGTFAHTSTLTASATLVANLAFAGTGAPASTQVYLLFGLTDPNLPVPGLCTNLRSDALIVLPLRVSTAAGAVTSTTLTTPWQTSYAGIGLVTQLLAADASQPGLPLALSPGLRSPMPLTAGALAPANHRRIYHLSSVTDPTGTGLSTSAVPVLYN